MRMCIVLEILPFSEEAKLLQGVLANGFSGACLDSLPAWRCQFIDDNSSEAIGKGGDPVGPDPPARNGGAHDGIA